MKVLHVIPSVSPRRGGPSAAIVPMVRALGECGVDASLVTTNDDGPGALDVPLGKWVGHSGVKTWFLPRFSPPLHAVREFAYAPGFSRWLRAAFRDFELIHVHALFSYVSSRAMTMARRNGVPYVLRPLGLLEEWSLAQSPLRKRAFLAFCDLANVRGAAAVHFTSEREREVSRLVPRGLGFIASLGVDAPQISPELRASSRAKLGVGDSECVILYLSRWHPKKRIEALLRALAPLSGEPWTLVLAGAGGADYEHAVRGDIERLGLRGRVRLPGFVEGEEKNKLLAAADAFVLPSHSENFGIAVAEAMAAGLPVIVSSGVALSRDIIDGDAGWVVEDAENELSTTLAEAVRSAEERERRGRNARNVAMARYSWQHCAAVLKARYEAILRS